MQGIPDLLGAIRQKLVRDNGVTVDDQKRTVVVTAGSNSAFLQLVLAICDEGDEIIISTPFYFNQEMACTMCGVVPVTVPGPLSPATCRTSLALWGSSSGLDCCTGRCRQLPRTPAVRRFRATRVPPGGGGGGGDSTAPRTPTTPAPPPPP